MILVWLIDKNNFYTGEIEEVESPNEYQITKPYLFGYVKGKWDKELQEWVEGATEEEIKEWEQSQRIDICPKPTTEERVLKLEEEKSILAENVYQLASILEIMLGGTESGQTETTTTDTPN